LVSYDLTAATDLELLTVLFALLDRVSREDDDDDDDDGLGV